MEDALTSENYHRLRQYVPSISGAGAGVICSIICSPLDVSKTRIQVQHAVARSTGSTVLKYRGLYGTLKVILAEEGIRGWYQGIAPALIVVPIFWAIYFGTYDYLKRVSIEVTGKQHHAMPAITAGLVTDLATNPIWVIRTRMQTQAMHPARKKISMVHMFRHIYFNEGIMAFWKGLSASLLGLGHVAIQFPVYERLKQMARDRHQVNGNDDTNETSLELAGASATSKLISTWITYPHELLRARMQDSDGCRKGLVGLTKCIIKEEGFLALWTGFNVNVVRVLPSCMATFVSYELISRHLRSRLQESR